MLRPKLTRSKLSTADTLEKLALAISNTPIESIKEKLREANGNLHGKDEILRDRFFRYSKRVLGCEDSDWHEILDVDRVSPKDIENFVKALEPQAIASELERLKCNTGGSVKILQNRLLRYYLRVKGFESNWTDTDTQAFEKTSKPQTELSDYESNMSKGKNSKNFSSSRQKRRNKSANNPIASSQSKKSGNDGELNPPTQSTSVTEMVPPVDIQTVQPNTETPKVNLDDLKDDTQLTVGLLKRILTDIRFQHSDSGESLKSSTVIKHPKSQKPKKPSLSPITKSSSSDSEDSNHSKVSQLSKIMKRLGVTPDPTKLNINIKSKLRKPKVLDSEASSSDSRDSSCSKKNANKILVREPRANFKRHKRDPCRLSSSGPESSSSSSSTSSDDSGQKLKRKRKPKRTLTDLPQTYKVMKSFDLKFSGNDNENAELFLEELLDCVENSKLDKSSALKAVSRMLEGHAKKWYQGEKAYIHTWSDFKKKFRKRFVPYHDDGDVYEDLHGRTQGEGERIAEYINNIKLIAAYFKNPPPEKTLVKRTIRNLLKRIR